MQHQDTLYDDHISWLHATRLLCSLMQREVIDRHLDCLHGLQHVLSMSGMATGAACNAQVHSSHHHADARQAQEST